MVSSILFQIIYKFFIYRLRTKLKQLVDQYTLSEQQFAQKVKSSIFL